MIGQRLSKKNNWGPCDPNCFYENTNTDTESITKQIRPQKTKAQNQSTKTAISDRVNPTCVVKLTKFNAKGKY